MESLAVTDMTAVTSAVLFRSESKGSAFHSNERTLGRCSPLKPLAAISIGNQAAKVKTTMLVSMSDFMIISFQKKNLILNEI